MSTTPIGRAAAATALLLLAATAGAHTGHGHDQLGFVQGLRHALGEPDHLLMLAFGFGLASFAAPRLVRLGQRLLRRLQRRIAATRREAA